MKRLAIVVPLLLAGCGAPGPDVNGSPDANQIERLATPAVEKPDPAATARLHPLTPADLESEGLIGAGCDFSRDGVLLLAAVGSDALVRTAAGVRHMIHSAPVGETGGFFEDRQLSVSVGRTEEDGAAAEGGTRWPARLRVRNRRTGAETELRGVWTCGS